MLLKDGKFTSENGSFTETRLTDRAYVGDRLNATQSEIADGDRASMALYAMQGNAALGYRIDALLRGEDCVIDFSCDAWNHLGGFYEGLFDCEV